MGVAFHMFAERGKDGNKTERSVAVVVYADIRITCREWIRNTLLIARLISIISIQVR